MFNRDQKNTLFIAALAIILGSLLGLASGCEGEGVADGTGGVGGAGVGGAAGGPGRGSVPCEVGDTCVNPGQPDAGAQGHGGVGGAVNVPGGSYGYPVTVTIPQPPASPDGGPPAFINRPCSLQPVSTSVMPGLLTGSCANCGYSRSNNFCYATPWCEPSVMSVGNNLGDPAFMPVNMRPVSAVCDGTKSTYTYTPGTIQVIDTTGNCVANTMTFTIEC